MSSPNAYTLVDRINDGDSPNRRRELETRFQVPLGIGTNSTSIRHPLPVVHSTDESKPNGEYSFIDNDNEASFNREDILFVCLDLHSQLTSSTIASLRAINNDVQIYTDSLTCFNVLRYSNDRIFFIITSTDKQLIEDVQNLNAVEAIFILNSEAHLDSRFPKLYGVYTYFEELLTALKDSLEWFEQTQMDLFVFQRDRIFFWSKLWKEEFIKSKKSKISSNKEKLVNVAENYYRGNLKLHQSINDFDQSYTKSDALQWCFCSPFPSRLLRRTLRSPNIEHLNACRFLLIDVSRVIHQQPNKKSSCELYKGMKATNEFLDKLETNTGKLICPKGFLLCSQSRKIALADASSPDHRPDLLPVLFKITYDTSVPIAEVTMKDTTPFVVFDVFTVFRVKYVNRNQVSIVKIEPADEDGRKLVREYRLQHESESVQNLLDQLFIPPKPPGRLPPLPRSALPLCVSPDLSTDEVSLSLITDDNEEMQAQELVKRGQIDEAIGIYQRLKPVSTRILNIIGMLYAEKKGDYESAIKYYKKALKLQEKNDEDVTDTLSRLGNVHQNRQEFDLALAYHSRALQLRKTSRLADETAVANSLIGIANAYWGQQNLSEAFNCAQQALIFNESIETGNDLNIAANLAILANIYHNSGNDVRALEVGTRALGLLERCVPSDSLALASLINNVATIQVAIGLFAEARHSFDRASEIFKKSLPEGHPKRIAMENNIQRITEMEQKMEEFAKLSS